MVIEKNKMVKIHYDLFDSNGAIIDSSKDYEPLEFLQGSGFVVEGLEEALEGKKIGDKFNVVISPEKGYGLRDENAIFSVDKKEFGNQINNISVGQQIQINSDNGSFIVTVSKILPDVVILDGNHPLAGIPLNFNIEVLDVRDATEEELNYFSNFGMDCDCDDDSCDCGCH